MARRPDQAALLATEVRHIWARVCDVSLRLDEAGFHQEALKSFDLELKVLYLYEQVLKAAGEPRAAVAFEEPLDGQMDLPF